MQQGDDLLEVLADQLRRRGWDARVVRYRVGGDIDVRLAVRQPGSVDVELLGRCGGRCQDHRWEAVRITHDGRAVWVGPWHACTRTEVIMFVEDLLLGDDTSLARRYTRLG